MRIPDNSPFTAGSTVWAYLRDSGGPGQDRSIEQQIEIARQYCDRHQLVLQEIFADAARHGDNADEREHLMRMIAQARETYPQVHDRKRREEASARLRHGIIFWSLARLGRDQIESAAIRADLRMRGLTVTSLSDEILTGNSALDPILEALIDVHNEMTLEVISREVKRGQHQIVSTRDTHPEFQRFNPDCQPTGRYLGIFPGRMAPRGYKFERIKVGVRRDGRDRVVQRLIPDPETWDRVILAWRMRVLDRASVPKIHAATHLYKDINGYSTFFKNRIYTGVLMYGGQPYGAPDDPYVQPAIPADWYEIEMDRRALRDQRRQPGGTAQPGDIDPRTQAHGRLLSGLLVCASCGGRLWAASEKPRPRASTGKLRGGWPHYICANAKRSGCDAGRVGAVRIEEAVVRKLYQEVLTPERLRFHADHLLDNIVDHRRGLIAELDSLERSLVEARRRAGNIADALAQQGTSAILLQRLEAEERTVRNLQQQIQKKQADLAYWVSFEIDDEQLARISTRLMEALNSGDVARARLAITSLILQIVVDSSKRHHEIRIDYAFPYLDPTGAPARSGLSLQPGKINVRRRHRNLYPADQKPKRGKGK